MSVRLETTVAKSSKAAADYHLDNNIEDQEGIVLKSISSVNGKSGIEVYSGSASGNNTAESAVGIYDTVNNEIVVFANTSCGSDD